MGFSVFANDMYIVCIVSSDSVSCTFFHCFIYSLPFPLSSQVVIPLGSKDVRLSYLLSKSSPFDYSFIQPSSLPFPLSLHVVVPLVSNDVCLLYLLSQFSPFNHLSLSLCYHWSLFPLSATMSVSCIFCQSLHLLIIHVFFLPLFLPFYISGCYAPRLLRRLSLVSSVKVFTYKSFIYSFSLSPFPFVITGCHSPRLQRYLSPVSSAMVFTFCFWALCSSYSFF